ncbi:AbfB domain-containing protein [Streptomyces sp. NPDC000405]|uniref:AbfB domain-containing protein n=1 Tax=Streptomyces sp. NPDC000405 TaxID=3161033 RepID=UPI00398CD0DC
MSKRSLLHIQRAVAYSAVFAALASAFGTATPASAKPNPAGVAAAESIRTTDQQRVDAATVVHLDPTPDVLLLSDQAFVHALWRKANEAGENLTTVRIAAEQAMASTSADDQVRFITSGVHEAFKLDVQREKERADAERAARLAKSQALIAVGIPSSPELLGLSDDNFIRTVAAHPASGPELRTACAQALLNSSAAWREFITNGIREAHQRDVVNKIKELEEKDRKEAERRKDIAARNNVAALFHVTPTDAMLGLGDDNFIRELLRSAPSETKTSELYSAADRAILSSDPKDWREFILTGAAAAYKRDDEARRNRIAENNRKLALRIQAAAGDMNWVLERAARKALAGTDEDVATFLKADNLYRLRRQSLINDRVEHSDHNYLMRQSSVDGGNIFISPVYYTNKLADREDATWVVLPALSGQAGCYSFESVRKPGYYAMVTDQQRVHLEPEDGTTGSQRRATWCARQALDGYEEAHSFESAAPGGGWLRAIRGELFVSHDVSGSYPEKEATWHIGPPWAE